MKKFITFLLCIIVFAAALCACGDSGKDPEITTQPENTQPKQTLPEKTTPPATTQPDSENTKLFAYEEISFTVPSKFEDITQELGGGMYHFVVGDKLIGVFGSRKDNLGASYLQYAAMVAQELGISADEITDCGGYARLAHHVPEIETSEEFGIFPVGHYVWVITIKCNILNFEGFRSNRDQIFQSVQMDMDKMYSGARQRHEETRAFQCKNIRLSLPSAFWDYSQQASGNVYFILGDMDMNISGEKEDGITPQNVFDTLAANTEISKPMEKRDPYYYLQYKDRTFFFDVYIFAYEDGVWILTIQTYQDAYDVFAPTGKEIVDSVEIISP